MNYNFLDKVKEKNKYENKNDDYENYSLIEKYNIYGSETMPDYYRDPYIKYENLIRNNIRDNHKVLEIAAGTGRHSKIILETKARVTFLDISPRSLEKLKNKYQQHYKNFTTVEGEMESLPFHDSCFDSVCIAGSLSYGKFDTIINEVNRVLKTNGNFIIVDSLNNNYVYALYRYLNYLIGNRTYSTLRNMPTTRKLLKLDTNFEVASANYFGSLSWFIFVLKSIIPDKYIANLIRRTDSLFSIKSSAFKFTILAVKK